MLRIDLGLGSDVYKGCEIEEVGGRPTFTTEPTEAAIIISRNTLAIIEATPADQRDEVVLTCPMTVWAYLIVFHQVVHKFRKVVYDDGRGGRVLVAQH